MKHILEISHGPELEVICKMMECTPQEILQQFVDDLSCTRKASHSIEARCGAHAYLLQTRSSDERDRLAEMLDRLEARMLETALDHPEEVRKEWEAKLLADIKVEFDV